MPRVLAAVLLGLAVAATSTAAHAQAAPAEPKPAEAKPPEKPRTLWEEITLFSYIENSWVFNLGKTGRHDVNELRLYDFDNGYTFNVAEFSLKKDPTERYPFGFGLVVTAGLDSQKNHAIGIFRDGDDVFPFRNTEKFDLQEAYGSYQIPIGNGLTLKAGKFVTLLGYEVIESPNNLNFSRGFLFTFAIPLTHVGGLFSYQVADWLTVTAGPVLGWDVAEDNNRRPSGTGQFAFTPIKDLALNLNWIAGPEQNLNDHKTRTVLDLTGNYTGVKGATLGLNVDCGWEDDEASLEASGTRNDSRARWWGWAAYAAYDWTEALRSALRLEYFKDADGVRTAAVAPGTSVELYSVTGTVQYKIWKGLAGRLEYRHDEADRKAFSVRNPGLVPTAKTQDTITLALYYSFF
jgi:opacity protein-like surface antigen